MRINRIYGFALGGAGRLLYRLKNLDCCYLAFPNNLEKIGRLINQQRLHSRYIFLSVPKNMKPEIASQAIEDVLQEFR